MSETRDQETHLSSTVTTASDLFLTRYSPNDRLPQAVINNNESAQLVDRNQGDAQLRQIGSDVLRSLSSDGGPHSL